MDMAPYPIAVDIPAKDSDKAAKWLYNRNIDYARYGYKENATAPQGFVARFRFKREKDCFEFILTWS